MEYYKAVRVVDGKYRSVAGNLEYTVGSTYTVEGPLRPYVHGFHACSVPVACWEPGRFNVDTDAMLLVRLADVLALRGATVVARTMTIIRALQRQEMLAACTGLLLSGVWTPVCGQAVNIPAEANQEWWTAGKLHRDGDMPAVVYNGGNRIWRVNGLIHRDGDMPAIVYKTGHQEWWQGGTRHREHDKPAVVEADGGQEWWVHGKRHRNQDKPAVVLPDGGQEWWQHGKRHRDQGQPAVVEVGGKQIWFEKGERVRHKDDGPPTIFLLGFGEVEVDDEI